MEGHGLYVRVCSFFPFGSISASSKRKKKKKGIETNRNRAAGNGKVEKKIVLAHLQMPERNGGNFWPVPFVFFFRDHER
jgi:hypothetical protein